MALLNYIEIETKSGYREFELHAADITQLDFNVDLIAFSAFKNDYSPVRGTVVGTFHDRGIDINDLAKNPLFDFRESFGTWVSREIKGDLCKYLACLEIVGTQFTFSESVKNLFSVLSVLEIKGHRISSIALPLLGAGNQMINPKEVISTLVDNSLDYLQHARYLNKIVFVIFNSDQAKVFDETMNDILGRNKVRVPRGPLVDGIKQEIIREIDKIILHSNQEVFNDLRRIILSDFRSFELGGISRKVLEFVVTDVIDKSDRQSTLVDNIRLLSKRRVAQWIISYMHTLRVFGNIAVHNKSTQASTPEYLSAKDLEVLLFCLQRILDFYNSCKVDNNRIANSKEQQVQDVW